MPYRSVIRESWMTPGLIKSARKRELLYRKTVGKARDSLAYIKYIVYRNLYNSIKRPAKDSYYENLLTKYQTDVRKTWKVLNSITGHIGHNKSISDTFLVNGDKITDEVVIANEFCSYFTNIRKQYAEAIPTSSKIPKSYLDNAPNPSSMYLTPTGPNEISSIIKSFQTKKSTGDDGISMQLLKQLSDSCSLPIANIINMSLHQGIVPDAMKLARVIPIYKAKSRDYFTNYRPIYCPTYQKCLKRWYIKGCTLS